VIRGGKIEPLEDIPLPEGAKVIVTLVSEEEDTQFWLSASETSLTEVWENTEDDVYAELLQE
jgi:predicted DNA-binding antitoxin AbrB/MazE fold protein